MSTSAKGRREVEEFIADSAHPRRDEIELVRQAILSARPDIGEQIKWNAPSFTYVGDDLVTFRLQPGDRIELILHRGAKKKADAEDFSFDDPTGLVEWVTNDRGILALADRADTVAKQAQITQLVDAWIEATAASKGF